jgi:hypothetical protein
MTEKDEARELPNRTVIARDSYKLGFEAGRLKGLEEVQKWTSCEDALPESGTHVLGYRAEHDNVVRSFIYLGGDFYCECCHRITSQPTHWRELPSPPAAAIREAEGRSKNG